VALAAESKNYEAGMAVIPHRIADMTGIEELAIHYPDVSALAATRARLRFPNSYKSAIIARDVLHVGYARMFLTIRKSPSEFFRMKRPPTNGSPLPVISAAGNRAFLKISACQGRRREIIRSRRLQPGDCRSIVQ